MTATLTAPVARLISHVNTRGITLDELRSIPTPKPLTDTHFPIAHATMLDLVLAQLTAFGLQVASTQICVTKALGVGKGKRSGGNIMEANAQMFAALDIRDESNKNYGFALGLRNSTDKSLAAALAFGAKVFVCDNLAFTGEEVINRRHTKDIMSDLPLLLQGALQNWALRRQNIFDFYDAMHDVQVSEEMVDHILMSAARAGAVPSSKANAVWDVYHDDASKEKHGIGTLWALYNAGTEWMKGRMAQNLVTGAADSHTWSQHFAKMLRLLANPTIMSIPSLPTLPDVVSVQDVQSVAVENVASAPEVEQNEEIAQSPDIDLTE